MRVDLSFSRFVADGTVIALPPDLAVLMVGVTARQAASPTALVQARLPVRGHRESRFAPVHGSFNAGVAALLRGPADTASASTQMKPPFTEPL